MEMQMGASGKPVVGLVVPVQTLTEVIYAAKRPNACADGMDEAVSNAVQLASPVKAKSGRLTKSGSFALSRKLIKADALLAIEETDQLDENLPRWRRNDALESIACHLELAARHAREAMR